MEAAMDDNAVVSGMRTVFCEKHGQWRMLDLQDCPLCRDERFSGLPRTPLGPCRIAEELIPNKTGLYSKDEEDAGRPVDSKPEQLSLF
jgi:hypothetical protein